MAGSLTDIFSAMQNGVVALGNFRQQLTGSLNNIAGTFSSIEGTLATILPSSTIARSSAIATIPSTFVITFNSRSSAVVPVQGDYPTSLIPGTTTNDNATAGNIGEYITSLVSTGTGTVGVASAVTTNITTVFLSAGDWDVTSNLYVIPSGTLSAVIGYISSQSATLPADNIGNGSFAFYQTTLTGRQVLPLGTGRVSLSAASTVYLVAQITYGTSATVGGLLRARKPR